MDDPYGSRLISLDPSYHANPYILDAGLADVERWPELNVPSSAPPSDDESTSQGRPHGRPTGFPGATGLKYTTTIMGNRTGGMGLRVSGKRSSTSGPRSSIRNSLRSEKKARGVLPDEPIVIDTIPPSPVSLSRSKSDAGRRELGEPRSSRSLSTDSKPLPPPPKEERPPPADNVPLPFIPKFKGAAEMEARRRLRMMNRVPPGGAVQRPAVPAQATFLNPELSSSSSSSSSSESDLGEEEDGMGDEDDEFDDDAPDVDDSIEIEADEFDP